MALAGAEPDARGPRIRCLSCRIAGPWAVSCPKAQIDKHVECGRRPDDSCHGQA